MVEKLRYRDLPCTNAFPLPTNVRGAARESKIQETDSRAYLGSKTVQPMGGSSLFCLTPAITGLHCGAKRRLRRSGAWPCWAVFLPLLLFYF